MLYNNLSSYLRGKYGTALRKICIDGGFTCPNRDGKCGRGGCIYCSERGSGEHIDGTVSICDQVKRALDSAKPTDRFIAYFQNFTNTYAPIDILRAKYDSALTDERIVALAIGTRPDCITEEITDLIASYSERVDVWVELGLQSASERTAKIINRGYTTDVYLKACSVLHSRKIPTVTHIMIGLPGEGDDELCETVGVFNLSGSMGIKIHSVYVASGTELCRMYESGEYSPISMETYIERAVYVISHIRPDVIIHRLTGDCPRELLVAPMWNAEKNKVIEGIRNNLAEKNLTQGKYCIR